MAIIVQTVFILSTLGLFDFTAIQVPDSNQCRLAETGSSQRQLSKLDAFGELTMSGTVEFHLQRNQNEVKYYMKIDSSNDNRLSFTTDETEKSKFMSQRLDENIFDVHYVEPSTNNRLCLQGVFPSVNETVDYTQAYARVGNCIDHTNIGGNVVPLFALSVDLQMAC